MSHKTDKENEVFVNLKSDFGFKRIFGRSENKELLKSFLNALFQGEIVVTDIKYDNVERTPDLKEDRGIRYDVYCHMPAKDKAGEASHHFIIEMQHQMQDNFDARALYYVASSLVWQGKKGNDFKFKFVPVIGIFLMDFDRNEGERNDRMVERKWLADRDTNEQFLDLLSLYFVKLPLMQKKADECTTERDMWIYCIKNLENMSSVPFVRENPVFGQLAAQASLANLSREEFVEYERSLKAYRDQRNIADYQYNRGHEKGKIEGRREGKIEGRKEERSEIAKNMIKAQMKLEDISQLTGLTKEELAFIKA